MEIRHVVNEGFFIFGENGDELAKLTYRKEGEKLYFESTVVSSELRGQGIAGKLFDAGVKSATGLSQYLSRLQGNCLMLV